MYTAKKVVSLSTISSLIIFARDKRDSPCLLVAWLTVYLVFSNKTWRKASLQHLPNQRFVPIPDKQLD
jgi:hypothetical protein